jgi:hypothetical protein
MNLKEVIQSQYRASLAMLEQVVQKYPEELWTDTGQKNPAWLLAYHALFYTHLYIHPSEGDFVPWEKFRPEIQFMGPTPYPPHDIPDYGEPYTRDEILSYIRLFGDGIAAWVDSLDLHGPSGFDWLPMSKIELQFYNIRHLMQHTGELAERLWVEAGIETGWVGKG